MLMMPLLLPLVGDSALESPRGIVSVIKCARRRGAKRVTSVRSLWNSRRGVRVTEGVSTSKRPHATMSQDDEKMRCEPRGELHGMREEEWGVYSECSAAPSRGVRGRVPYPDKPKK